MISITQKMFNNSNTTMYKRDNYRIINRFDKKTFLVQFLVFNMNLFMEFIPQIHTGMFSLVSISRYS